MCRLDALIRAEATRKRGPVLYVSEGSNEIKSRRKVLAPSLPRPAGASICAVARCAPDRATPGHRLRPIRAIAGLRWTNEAADGAAARPSVRGGDGYAC